MTTKHPKISVVIPCFNGANTIECTLDSVFSQTLPPDQYEVIVVDNNSSDDTKKVLSRLRRHHPNLVTLMERKPGVAPTRNKGAAQAKAKIILFLDDDMIASPRLLEEHLTSHGQHDGSVLGYFTTNLKGKPDPFLFYLEVTEEQNAFPMKNGSIINYQFFYTGNVSVKRKMFEKVGGFDENFEGGGVEDIDLGYQMSRFGDRLLFNKNATSEHIYFPHYAEFKRKKIHIGSQLAYFLHKNPELQQVYCFEGSRRIYALGLILSVLFLLIKDFLDIALKIAFKYYYWSVRLAMLKSYKERMRRLQEKTLS